MRQDIVALPHWISLLFGRRKLTVGPAQLVLDLEGHGFAVGTHCPTPGLVPVIAVVITVAVPPIPVFLLLVVVQLAKVAMRVAMGFGRPLVVEDDLVIVPAMIVVVVGIVGAVVVVLGTSGSRQR